MRSVYNCNSSFLLWQLVNCKSMTSLVSLVYSTYINSKISFLTRLSQCVFFAEEVTDLLHNLQASEQVTCQVWPALVAANMAGSDLTEIITEYTREAQTGNKLLKTLINAYEAEIQRLQSMDYEDHLSGHQ